MARLKNILLISVLTLFFIQPAVGQGFLDRLSKKVSKQMSEDKSNGEKDNSEKMDLSGLMKGLGLSTTPVPIDDVYKFDHLIQMHIESFDKGGKKESDSEFITHFNPNTKSMAYQAISGDMAEGQGVFIIDAENKATIILTEDNGEKAGIVYGLGGYLESIGKTYEEEDVDMAETPESYAANPNVKKTGRTKTIAGYKCEEYVYDDEYSKSNVWITKDMKLNAQDFMSTLFKTSIASQGMGWGYMMEATSVDKESGEKSIMKVTKVDNNSHVRFSMSDYEITNLGSFQQPEEEK